MDGAAAAAALKTYTAFLRAKLKDFEERAALEARYQKLYQPLYTKRAETVNGDVEIEGGAAEQTGQDEEDILEMKMNLSWRKQLAIQALEELKNASIMWKHDNNVLVPPF